MNFFSRIGNLHIEQKRYSTPQCPRAWIFNEWWLAFKQSEYTPTQFSWMGLLGRNVRVKKMSNLDFPWRELMKAWVSAHNKFSDTLLESLYKSEWWTFWKYCYLLYLFRYIRKKCHQITYRLVKKVVFYERRNFSLTL